ncbi:Reverse transcriptase (RNA-dependent DNA polymerase) [uncultured archaeon]|nr:Reverse transcriptase (RNA-dependent DNA polymerase) [uncultured archaeon]
MVVYSFQDLMTAWNKVKENRGCAGADSVTLEEFEQDLDSNLNSLQKQLEIGDYSPLPVLRVYIDKEDGGKRSIGIPAVRDRIVQQVLLSNILPIFEKEFLDCSFAYRPGRSALIAIDRTEELIKKGGEWVLDGDIEKFFDSVDHDLLLGFVAERISDPIVLRLIKKFLKTGIFENMSLHEEYCGITQGNVISPLLANVFLHQFDLAIMTKGYHLIRYADDFVILEDSQERINEALTDTAASLKVLKLNLSKTKTKILHARDGFVFLGYYIDANGKGPSKKAISAISLKLREISDLGNSKKISEIIDDLKESIRGWSSYFHTIRGIEPENALTLIALTEMSLASGDGENAQKLFGKRKDFTIDQADIWYRLGTIAQNIGYIEDAFNSFSRALAIVPEHILAKDSIKQLQLVDENVHSSIERLKRLIRFCPDLAQPYRDLAFCYSELGQYGLAQESYKKAMELDMGSRNEEKPEVVLTPRTEAQPLIFSDEDASLFSSIFKGREEFFARQWIDEKGRRGFSPVDRPLNPAEIKSHLDGKETLGLYLLDKADQVSLSVIDIDIEQKALLEYAKDEEESLKLHSLTHQDASRIASVCDDLGIPLLIEDSGYKGRHIWFFFESPIKAKLARIFIMFITERAGKPGNGIHREIFPNCDKLKGKGYGPLIKLPLGIHKRTGRRCLFLDRDGNPLQEQMASLSKVGRITQKKVEEILFARIIKPDASPPKKEKMPLVESMLSGCKVVNYLVNKAKDTHYLNNSERVTLLYTLGLLGQEGKDFLHRVISNCINYDYDYTEKQIKKMKSYPISCFRIRERHEDFALDLGCNCSLKFPPGGYPSPVLHAFGRRNKWLFQPHSLSASESHENKVILDGINGKLKTYIELKKQLGGVEKSIHRIEEEMSSYFDREKTDSIATEYGLLERKRKAGDKFEWMIKL